VRHPVRTAAVALAAVACTLLAACSAGSGAGGGGSQAGSAGKALAIGLSAEPASLDFTKTDGSAIPQALLENLYEGLVKLDQSGKIVPSLAKSWTLSADRKTYTFDLVNNAKFSNGAPFTAEDAKFSIDRVKTDWTVSLKSGMDVVQKVDVVSPTQLTVTLSKSSNGWLYGMTTRIGAMFSRTGVDQLATNPIGTGPYKLDKWTRGDSISLVRNEDYWGKKPFFQTVAFKYFKDPTALNNALLSGTINVIGSLQTPESLGQFQSAGKYQVIEGTTNSEVVLSMNNAAGPMSDIRVRKAVRYAIDHKALLDTCWAGNGQLIGSMVPPTDPWYEDLTGLYPHDVAKAKELLQESGKANVTLRLRLPTRPYATSCGTVVKSQLEQAGFKVVIDQLEFPAAWLTTVFKNHDYDMSIIAHTEPRDIGTVFTPPSYTGYNNPAFSALLAQADAGTEQQQIADMKKAARMISEDSAADFLFLLPNLIVADKGITGLLKNAITESFDVTGLARS